MYYLQSRYYNAEWGRFINADGIIEQAGDLIGHNLFAYCKNNPINKFDSEGFNSMDYFPIGGGACGGLLEVVMIGKLTIEEALPEIEQAAPKVLQIAQKSSATMKFVGDRAVSHFEEHASQIMKVTNRTSYNLKEYVNEANEIIQSWKYLSAKNAYVKVVEAGEKIKYAYFVGLTRDMQYITTFHIKSIN